MLSNAVKWDHRQASACILFSFMCTDIVWFVVVICQVIAVIYINVVTCPLSMQTVTSVGVVHIPPAAETPISSSESFSGQ